MANVRTRTVKFTILEILAGEARANRFNMLGGRGNSLGTIEWRLGVVFDDADRRRANIAFDELLNDELIQPTFTDLCDPSNWLMITAAGRTALERRALDELDKALLAIDPSLCELRDGAWSALSSDKPDAHRQAAHSARELIEQTLLTQRGFSSEGGALVHARQDQQDRDHATTPIEVHDARFRRR